MELIYISIFVGVSTFLILSITEDLILGDRGRRKQISNYFKYIKGNTVPKKEKELKKTSNYKIQKMSRRTYIAHAIPACIGIFLIIYKLSKSIGLAFFISLLGLIYPKTIMETKLKKRNATLNIQLRDALNSIVSSLKAGLSINSALIKCSEDLEKLYSLIKEKPMLDEFNKIKSDLNMGMSVDDALRNFMKRIKMEDIDDFVNSVIIVRQKGGNLVEVVTNVSKMITDKIEMKREIETFTASKKLESKVISLLPIFLIVALSILSPNYMKPLYESAVGKVFIVIGFIFLVVNYFVAKKIVDIEV